MQLLEQPTFTRPVNLLDNRSERSADAGNFPQPARLDEAIKIALEIFQSAGAALVSLGFKGILALYGEKAGNRPEIRGDFESILHDKSSLCRRSSPIVCNVSNARSRFDLETYDLVYNYNLASQVGVFRQHGWIIDLVNQNLA